MNSDANCLIEKLNYGVLPTPARVKNNIPIAMASSASFLPYTCVTLLSLLDHGNDDSFYDVLLFHESEYSSEGIDLLQKVFLGRKNCKLRLVDLKGWEDDIKFEKHTEGHVSSETYARLLLPIIMQHYTDVLYLDGDLIICRDVADLFASPAQNAMLSGVVDVDVLGQYYGPDFSMKYYLNNKLSLHDPTHYLQCGVLIFNIPAIRNILGEKALIERCTGSRFRYFDQDVLNCLCNEHICPLDLRWNVVTDCNKKRLNIIQNTPSEIYQKYLSSRKDPWIIHFSGEQKPWNDPKTDFSDRYNEYSHKLGLKQPELLLPQRQRFLKELFDEMLPYHTRRRELLKIFYFMFKYKNSMK